MILLYLILLFSTLPSSAVHLDWVLCLVFQVDKKCQLPKWFFWEQPAYWSHLCYKVQGVFFFVWIGEQHTFSAAFQHSSRAHRVLNNWWLLHAHMRTHTVLNTKDVYSSTFAHRILQTIEIKIKWLQSQNTHLNLHIFLFLIAHASWNSCVNRWQQIWNAKLFCATVFMD